MYWGAKDLNPTFKRAITFTEFVLSFIKHKQSTEYISERPTGNGNRNILYTNRISDLLCLLTASAGRHLFTGLCRLWTDDTTDVR